MSTTAMTKSLATAILSASASRDETANSRYPFGKADAVIYRDSAGAGFASALTLRGEEEIVLDENAILDNIPSGMTQADAEWLAGEILNSNRDQH